MIVVDNVAAPMRLLPSRSIDARVHVINKLARDLRKLAAKFNIAVLAVNQMTTRRFVLQPAQSEETREEVAEFRNVPSLGTTWQSHMDVSIALRIQNSSVR